MRKIEIEEQTDGETDRRRQNEKRQTNRKMEKE